MTDRRRRLLSWWWDYLVVLAWLALVFLAVGLPTLLGWLDLAAVWSRPVTADLAVTVLTVLPYHIYLVRTEAAPAHATWGKRRSGLVVEAAGASRDDRGPGGHASPSSGSVVVRNLIKVLPWQFGHMAAMRFSTGVDPGWAVAFYVVSIVLLVLVAGPALVGRRGLHDLIARTTVQASTTP